ncbi:histidine kinase [Halobacteriales archaeon SW_7_68_16]|nr:MAG: histidine kinase [Halobacteriales archaeon SW_7_68_16]
MTLAEIVDDVRGQEKTLWLLNPTHGTVAADARAYFETQNVRVTVERTASGEPVDCVMLARDGDPLVTVQVADLVALMTETPRGDDGLGFDDSAYGDLLCHLKETTFTSYDTARMIEVSKEIEDRAWRTGVGRLHTGFQRVSNMFDQIGTYAALGEKRLDVHTYGVPDAEPPAIDGVTVHDRECHELARSWFVAFDGGGHENRKCALLAQRQDGADRFYGIWTYDPGVVDRILDHLESTYGRIARDM